jgi:hypothetical protein
LDASSIARAVSASIGLISSLPFFSPYGASLTTRKTSSVIYRRRLFMVGEAPDGHLWGHANMISALVVARLVFQPLNRELQMTWLWAAAGLLVFGMMVHLGFANEMSECLALE